MAKATSFFVCSNCAYETSKWLGQCPSCNEWNTFEQLESSIVMKEIGGGKVTLGNIDSLKNEGIIRTSTGFSEFDRVMGGGLVAGEVILISGEPGIGKSTFLLQILAQIENALYVSAEESLQQVLLRAKRLKISNTNSIQVLSGFEINTILKKVDEIKPKILVVDSIQTVYEEDVRGLPGGISQIKSVSSKLIKYAKENEIILFIVGQVTKDGGIAGPKLLEHLVDVVLEMVGEEKMDFRIIRCLKNRFGRTDEIGLFEMAEAGLVEITNPSVYFIEDSKEDRVGVCLGTILEGNRVIIVEIQGLSVKTFYPLPKRITQGISKARLEVLSAIISKYTKFDLSDKDLYVNIASGLQVKDSMLDLTIVLALISSLINKPLKHNLVALGEVSLTGEIRINKRAERIEKECVRLGYKMFNKAYPQIKHISQIHKIFA
jgi:DNA repair protein RadA/Sms